MEELLDLLMSFVDFQAFKELMLAHKSEAVTSSIHVRTEDVNCHLGLHVAMNLEPQALLWLTNLSFLHVSPPCATVNTAVYAKQALPCRQRHHSIHVARLANVPAGEC